MEKRETKKKVLIVNTIGMGHEGMSNVILNYLRNMSLEGMEVHITASDPLAEDIAEILEALGTVHMIPIKQRDLKGYLRGIWDILKMGIDVFHVHGNSGTMAMEAVLAKLCGVKKVLIHAHSTKTNHPVINTILKYPMMLCADHRIACSKAAGQWLYGKHPYTLLNNAIDLSRFRYQDSLREQYRAEFGVKDEFLIGHVGHFTEQKNHFFLIDIFEAFHRMEPASRLLLLSNGPRFQQVKEKVAQLGLQDAVIFAGSRSDVAGIYSAMDLFLLPSCWEGLPLVMLEAQANGLPLLVSDVITQEAKCTDRTFYKSLDQGAESWARELQAIRKANYDRREDTCGMVAANGFDIHMEAEKLRKLYLQDV